MRPGLQECEFTSFLLMTSREECKKLVLLSFLSLVIGKAIDLNISTHLFYFLQPVLVGHNGLFVTLSYGGSI